MGNKKLFLFGFIVLFSCKTQRGLDADNLPQDISLIPNKFSSKQMFSEYLQSIKLEIYNRINSIACEDVTQWRISPLGSKACGGPQEYIAYPVQIEREISQKIKSYTEQEKKFNENFGITSDCTMVQPPKDIKCESGKVVLISSSKEVPNP